MRKSIAVLGGGVGGLTAAHELADRGFQVTVYELKEIPGGKARSIPVPGSGKEGRRELPGEHGFRFFPGFYRHLPYTMKRIPFGDGKTVFDNLVTTSRVQIARTGNSNVFTPAHYPASIDDLALALRTVFTDNLDVPTSELAHFAERLLVLLTSCHERRLTEYEHIDWWTFVGAEDRSREFQKYCADGLTRCLVALKAREMSTRTGGYVLLQLMMDVAEPGGSADRILNGPTNDVWLTPWRDQLTKLGVDFQLNTRVEALHCDGKRLTGVTVLQDGQREEIKADYYVAALPVEVMQRLVTAPLIEAAPSLGSLERLQTAWMVGVQFYMDRDVSIARGHSLYLDAPWALTSISQKQFWPEVELSRFGNGQVKDVLSIDISDWDTPGVVHNKPARECTAEEIKEEVWAQILAHFGEKDAQELSEAKVLDWFLDPAIIIGKNAYSETANLEPLLINTKGSWDYRPGAVTEADNLVLAADYVRTHTDLATMEAANEAARRAVNGILDACGSEEPRCGVWPLKEVRSFAALRAYDRMRLKRGRPHDPRPVKLLMRFPRAMQFMMDSWRKLSGRARRSNVDEANIQTAEHAERR